MILHSSAIDRSMGGIGWLEPVSARLGSSQANVCAKLFPNHLVKGRPRSILCQIIRGCKVAAKTQN